MSTINIGFGNVPKHHLTTVGVVYPIIVIIIFIVIYASVKGFTGSEPQSLGIGLILLASVGSGYYFFEKSGIHKSLADRADRMAGLSVAPKLGTQPEYLSAPPAISVW